MYSTQILYVTIIIPQLKSNTLLRKYFQLHVILNIAWRLQQMKMIIYSLWRWNSFNDKCHSDGQQADQQDDDRQIIPGNSSKVLVEPWLRATCSSAAWRIPGDDFSSLCYCLPWEHWTAFRARCLRLKHYMTLYLQSKTNENNKPSTEIHNCAY